jgi:hypothetical protein
MRSRERVLTAVAQRAPDRVPIDYKANPGIDQRLKEHFGLRLDDDEGLLQALGVDFRRAAAPYVGPKLHPDVPGRQVDMWGIHRRWIAHESGGYWDFCDFPLREATLAEIEAWPMPSPDDFDYTAIAGQCRDYQLYLQLFREYTTRPPNYASGESRKALPGLEWVAPISCGPRSRNRVSGSVKGVKRVSWR